MPIPEIELTITKQSMHPRSINCYICGIRMPYRMMLASRMRFGWKQKVPYSLWHWWMRLIGEPTSLHFHDECLPEGWRFWTIEYAQDVKAYHSLDAEVELMKMFIRDLET